jgi:hypothetical protein
MFGHKNFALFCFLIPLNLEKSLGNSPIDYRITEQA